MEIRKRRRHPISDGKYIFNFSRETLDITGKRRFYEIKLSILIVFHRRDF